MTPTNLVGMFLVLDDPGHEYYRTGEIVAAVGDCYLIQFDRMRAALPPPLELHTLEQLSGTCPDCDQKLASLFRTRAEMAEWIERVNAPEAPAEPLGKIINIKKPH
jgi:hypothetical protein